MSLAAVGVDSARRHRLLERVTLVYLALPFLVFAAGWLKPLVAVPCIGVTLAGLHLAQRPTRPVAADPLPRGKLSTYAAILVVVVCVVICSGTGGYAVALGGHFRNEAFIHDLMRYPWPLGFEELGRLREPGVVAFYIGNAILPALVGSLLGWAAAFHFQFAWTCLGVFLAACWFVRVVGSHSLYVALVFLFFGGLDLVADWALVGWYSELRRPPDLWMFDYAKQATELGGVFWIFPSPLTILFNSPHHVLASWLALLVIVDDAVHAGTCRRAGFVSAFCLLSSALSFVGLAPFVVVALVTTRARGMWSFENAVAGVVVLAVSALYVGSNNGDFPHGPLWLFQNPLETWPVLLFAALLDFGVYAGLILLLRRDGRGLAHPVWLWTAVATLAVLPWYRLGKFCDLNTKGSIPALVVVALCVAHVLANAGREQRLRVAALVAVLVVGSVSALTQIGIGVSNGLDASPPAEGRWSLPKIARRSEGAPQLFSDGKGFFWRALARPVVYQPARAPGDR